MPFDVQVIVRLVVPFGVDGPPLPQPARVIRMTIAVTIPSRVRNRRVINMDKNRSRASSNGTSCLSDNGFGGVGMVGGDNIDLCVVTVTADVTAVTPSAGVTGVAGVHVASAGAPVHATVTA